MRARSTLRILFFAGWASTATLLLWIHRSARLGPDELNVCEAVFRYQIDSVEKAIPGSISTYYLSVNDLNPPQSLLDRLRADNLHVARGSFFLPDLWKGAWHSVIRSMERIDDRTFLVHGGYENGGLSASGEDYTVVHRDGRWSVERAVLRIVA